MRKGLIIVLGCLLGLSVLTWFGVSAWRAGSFNRVLRETREMTIAIPEDLRPAQFAGLVMADRLGLFADAGFQVNLVRVPVGTELDDIGGRAQFAMTDGFRLIKARSRGNRVVAVFVTYPRNEWLMAVRQGLNVKSPADWSGLHIGVRPGSEDVVHAWAERIGVPIEELVLVPRSGFGTLGIGEQDMALLWGDEVLGIREELKQELPLIAAADFEVPGVDGVLAVSEAMCNDEEETVGRFLKVVEAGWREAALDPTAAAEAVNAAGYEASVQEMRLMSKMIDADDYRHLGGAVYSDWVNVYRTLERHGELAAPFDVIDAFTRRHLM